VIVGMLIMWNNEKK